MKNLNKRLKAVNKDLTNEMYLSLSNKDGNKKLYGWSLIPNVARFQIVSGTISKVGKTLGISKKIGVEGRIISFKKNDRMRRYCRYQLRRLIRNKQKKYVFFAIVDMLIKRSLSFRIAALNHVIPNGYCKYPIGQINKWAKKLQYLIEKKKDDLEYYRVYIEKNNDTGRPLGVPKMEGRILLHMGSNFLQLYLSDHYLESQHGYLGNRGTLSAGKELSKVIDSKYIYECDLKQFFPSVHVNEISRLLDEYNVPKGIVYFLENLNLNQPILPSTDKQLLDESKYIRTQQDYEDIKNGYFRYESPMYDPVREFIDANGIEVLYEVTGSNNIFEIVQEQGALFDMYSPAKVKGMFEGVPQGSPISPLLSILTLRDFLTQEKSISYADDPIFYSNEDFTIKDDPEKGIVLNESKSGWVKRNGKFLKPLRYLGLELTSDYVRNGKKDFKLEGSKAQEIYLVLEGKKLEHGKEFFNADGFGTIMARLYSGSGESKLEKQNFELESVNNSLSSMLSYSFKGYKVDIFNASTFSGFIYAKKVRHIRQFTKFVLSQKRKLIRRVKVN